MATALVSGVFGNVMMTNEEGALKCLWEYLVAHLFQNQPTPDQSDRALRAVSGGLGRNAPFVEASFLPLRGARGSVKTVAISPEGKIAIVLWRSVGKDEFDELCLVVWKDGSVTKPRVLGTAEGIFDEDSIRVFFPEGSDDPAVVIGGGVLWGDATFGLPWKAVSEVPVSACLTVFEEGGRKFAAYIDEDRDACLFPFSVPGVQQGGSGGLRGKTLWLGLVGGELVRITATRNAEAVRWRDIVVPIESVVPTVDGILPESIGVADGGIQFVAKIGNGHRAVWSDGTTRREVAAPGDLFFDRGEIYGIGPRGVRLKEIVRFEKGRFVPIGYETDLLPSIEPGTEILAFGSTVVVSNFNLPAKAVERRACVITPGHRSSAPCSKEDLALRRFHTGMGIHRRNGAIHWAIPTAADVGTKNADFPLYGLPFDRLIATEDDRGHAIMSWAFVDGTFHVLRYPLPR